MSLDALNPTAAEAVPQTRPGLAVEAYERLRRFYAVVGHQPSEQQFIAIRDLLNHLELAALGQLDPALYVSTLPAGTGKTTAVWNFAKALLSSAEHASVGMLITVNRITEVEDIALHLADYSGRLCVITSDQRVNEIGANDEADEAQICICTQAALRQTLRETTSKDFNDAKRFLFRGRRRAITVHDEQIAFNRPVVLDPYAVVDLTRLIRKQSEAAGRALLNWVQDIDHADGVCDVPDFTDLGVKFSLLLADAEEREELTAIAKALEVINGGRCFVRRDGERPVMITHFPEIPPSLMPVIVTDASARVNRSYRHMARKAPLKYLIEAPKTYRNMKLRLVNTAASRSTFREKSDRGSELIDMAVRYVESVPPGEPVLIVGYTGRFKIKGHDTRNVPAAVRKTAEKGGLEEALRCRLSSADQDRVSFITYGRHTATNKYQKVKHVLLLGLNFIPDAANHAAAGAAMDLDLIDQHPTDAEIRDMRRGNLMDNTLQAVLRGNARMGVNGDCGEMEVVIAQIKQSGLTDDDYRTMFPEVDLRHDSQLVPEKPLSGRPKELADIITRRRSAGEIEMTNQRLWEELGMSRTNFLTLVKRPDFQVFIKAAGLLPQRLGKTQMGLRAIA